MNKIDRLFFEIVDDKVSEVGKGQVNYLPSGGFQFKSSDLLRI